MEQRGGLAASQHPIGAAAAEAGQASALTGLKQDHGGEEEAVKYQECEEEVVHGWLLALGC
jgi:hypothetical protein